LAAWVGHAPEALIGHPLPDVFKATIPALAVVVEEAYTSGSPVRDYRVSFTDHAGVERTVLMQAARRPGQPKALIAVRCEELPRRAAAVMPDATRRLDGLIGNSQAMQSVRRKIEIYGPTDAPVLITGETGTGKELAARALHAHSRRRRQPFVAVNCAALSDALLESELFGHEKGAFTSAVRLHYGRFERANGGTLFLDEIGDMPLGLQAKLLRVLEAGVIERVGGEREVAVNVRIVSATNTALEAAVQARAFRLDLYHRLEVLRIHMPPLRERLDDIPLLVEYFLEQFNARYQRSVRGVTPEALKLLQAYSWPGNIRELRNVLERVYVETDTEVIGHKAFNEWVNERTRFYPGTWDLHARQAALAARPALITPYPGAFQPTWSSWSPASDPGPIIDAVSQPLDQHRLPPLPHHALPEKAAHTAARPLTRECIIWALQQAAGNVTRAARLLGVHKTTLYRYMKALGVTRDALAACSPTGYDRTPVGSAQRDQAHE
jgi:sigma-54 specific flagellar transcriptional regulator A